MDTAAAARPLPQRITLEAIHAARDEYQRRLDEAEYEDEGVEIENVVIARNVTIPELRTVPMHWFDDVKIALLVDGSLVVTDVKCRLYRAATDALGDQLDEYARATGVRVDRHPMLRGRDGSVMMPTFAISVPYHQYRPPQPRNHTSIHFDDPNAESDDEYPSGTCRRD